MSLDSYIAEQFRNPTGVGGKLISVVMNKQNGPLYNVSKMSFAESSFNKAYTINTVYFWENLSITMAEIWRVLK